MLALYLITLLVGGVFVGLSAFSGGDDGHDHDADHGDGDLGHADGDAGHDLDLDPGHDLAPTLADASHGPETRARRWNPLLSLRFWTFGAAFFGLTGTLLTTLTERTEPLIVLLSSGAGVLAGLAITATLRWLRHPVPGDALDLEDWRGASGVLALPLKPGGLTRARVTVRHRIRDVLARTDEPLALPKGTRVVVLGFDEDGRVRVVPEASLETQIARLESSAELPKKETP